MVRDLVARARDAGHRIGNHTLTHAVELGASDDGDVCEREIGEAQHDEERAVHVICPISRFVSRSNSGGKFTA